MIAELKMPDGDSLSVCFYADMAGNAYAWNADNGKVLWNKHIASPIKGSHDIDFHNINDNWCFLSAPTIDIERGVIYLCSWSSPNHTVKNASFHIHALKISDGTLIRPPESLQGVVYKPPGGLPEQRFNSAARKQRAALTLSQVKDGHGKSHKIPWIAFGSVKETGLEARGWVVAIDVQTWTKTAWTSAVKFNGGGIWQGAQGLTVEPQTGDSLGMTGNGAFDGISEFGECFFRLRYTFPPQIACIDHWSPFSDTGRDGADPTLVDDSLIPGKVKATINRASNFNKPKNRS